MRVPRAGLPRRDRSAVFVALAAIILGIAFAARLWNLGTQSLWHDEAWSIFSAYHPLAWGAQGTDPNAPPVFYLSLGAWMQFVGDGVWALRYWSLLLSLITVAVGLLIGRRWFGSAVGLLAGALIAINPILWVFAQEIRAYVVMPLAALLLLWLLDQVLRTGARRAWLWLLVVEALALYAQNLAVPLVAWLNVTAIIAICTTSRAPMAARLRKLSRWILAQAVLGIAYVPWLITQRPTGTALNTPPPLDLTLIANIWQAYFTGIRTLVNADPLLMALTAVFGALAVIAAVRALLMVRGRRVWLLASQVVLIPVFETAIIYAAHIDFHPRYFIVAVPATLLLIAVGMAAPARVPGTTRGKHALAWRVAFSAGGFAVGAAVSAQMAAVTFSSSIYQHDDFRAIAQHYAALGPDDAVIIPYNWEPTLDYYRQKMALQARFIGIPLYSSGEAILNTLGATLPTLRSVEFLTWYQLPADGRGAYPCILGAYGQMADSLTVQGLRTVRYANLTTPGRGRLVDSDPASPSQYPVQRDPNGAMTGILWGRTQACVITQWETTAPAPGPLNASARLRTGWETHQADGPLLDDRGLPAPFWKSTQPTLAFAAFPLPDALPPGQYPFTVMLYPPHGDPQPTRVQRAIREPGYPTLGPDTAAPLLWQLDPQTWLYEAQSPADASVRAGDTIPIRLAWARSGAPGEAANAVATAYMIQLVDADGKLLRTVRQPLSALAKQLTWHLLRVPPDARGTVTIRLSGPTGETFRVGQWAVEAPDLPVAPPDALRAAQPTQATFDAAGTLIGFKVPRDVLAANAFDVTLFWQATPESAASPDAQTGYRVFIHLLNASGEVIAQSDGIPGGGVAPFSALPASITIQDIHSLTWNKPGYRGPATLEVGIYTYSAFGADRIPLTDGADHFVLPVAITVK
jgi:4-amino-4-deoxy-L-arabinose transferase-like glycosyltransferase